MPNSHRDFFIGALCGCFLCSLVALTALHHGIDRAFKDYDKEFEFLEQKIQRLEHAEALLAGTNRVWSTNELWQPKLEANK